jgi:hypothetical protein
MRGQGIRSALLSFTDIITDRAIALTDSFSCAYDNVVCSASPFKTRDGDLSKTLR